jgi:outer membrane receptor for ferrienterochelin and colicin
MEAHTAQTEPGQVSLLDSWNSPRNNVSGSVSWTVTSRWSANSFFSYVGALPSVEDNSNSAISVPDYTRLDFSLMRKVGRSLEFQAGGSNLLAPRHFEFMGETSFNVSAQVPRSAFIKATWTFR